MKRALSVILIFVALTNIVGFMPLYFSLLQEVKSEALLKMAKTSDLQKLCVTTAELNNPAIYSATDEHEFMFKGKMYDYKEVKKENGFFTFYALQDSKESGLVDFLTATFEDSGRSASSSKAPLGKLLKSFSKDFVGNFSQIVIPSTANAIDCNYVVISSVSAGHYPLLLNPPEAAC